MKIVIDGMGGDNAPKSNVEGAVNAIKEYQVDLIITGYKDLLEKEFSNYEFDRNKLEIVHTTEIIENEDKPVKAIRSKKDSSMVVALNLVKEGKADAIISAGNTGALLAGGLFVVGRIKGIDRPCLCSAIPNVKRGMTLIADCGANADCKSKNLVEFAAMSNIYSRKVLGLENPKVALANVGLEEGKGNDLVKKSYEEIKKLDLNFIGNVEAREVINAYTDIIICDGFTGNILLKSAEGVALSVMSLIKETFMASTKSKIGALLIKDDLKKLKSFIDYSEYGGAPLLGLNGGVIKAHGSSDAKAIKNAINQGIKFTKGKVVEDINQFISKYNEENKNNENE
ncbi:MULTISPECIES: phosphate acyltransferase PlsX [unclassified Clostridioides]|uniref:phosphate acyltransferase PlsX n=1 Tax=unclassified Clostridioides TaxID=2635829 RepID=UPI001D1273CE|nr:phosphate acyltransferase PlsX [Clostridioides sp. ZZV14-6150]MCC0666674.1 phosphate acyltransferase PlsX [Clostridioides sp. ZZV14-6153]MCC0722735.1 phosphate acyltransferase PlsX [Clostridioides sp. ZZV14-6104]MCC0725391.1 phosphate acyltransferase PlsX [Clostridioides sp. ZZV14-6045]MCC0734114.1 phosphate acyltransferase PlsX [Clostridioides sp. ZZV14-6009]MCC0737559.1 phosphate acyltransferase PlsX [Clostridioides sp. ZZV14-5902]MCC0742478.1 phosphate acyltransferase PlsX [Clostridioid